MVPVECATTTKVYTIYVHSYETFFAPQIYVQCIKVSLVPVVKSLLQLTHMIGPVQTSMHLALVQGLVIAGRAIAD